jgi:diguanylate cyclase
MLHPSPVSSPSASVDRSTGGHHLQRSYWATLQRAARAAAAVHLAFSGLFLVLGAPLMAWANLGSVSLYVLADALLRHRRNREATILLWLEILLHALVATWVLGWDSGFHYYVMLMVPMVFVSPGRTGREKALLGMLLGAYYLILDYHAQHSLPITALADGVLDAVRYFNVSATLALLAYLAHVYMNAVRHAERRLRDLAATDALTGLANRHRALEVTAVQTSGRRRNDGPLSFILCDVDHFKAVNDRHGHEVGDQALVAVSHALRAATREQDTVCRWGGEEFLVFLPGTDHAAALKVGERVRQLVGEIRLPGCDLELGITLGVSTLRADETVEAAISRADSSLYQGKLAGRNQCVGEATVGVPSQRKPSTAF